MSKENEKRSTDSGYNVVELDVYSKSFGIAEEEKSEFQKRIEELENGKQSKFKKFLKKFIPWHGDGTKEILRKVIFIVALVVFIFSLVYIVNYEVEKNKNNDLNKSFSDEVSQAEDDFEKKVNEIYDAEFEERFNQLLEEMRSQGKYLGELTDEQKAELARIIRERIMGEVRAATLEEIKAKYPNVSFPEGILLKLADLYGRNQDLIGWIRIPNTVINYPVVQSLDNSKYLRRNFYGESSRFGTIFADYRSKLKDGSENFNANSVLYGHYLYTGTMFTQLRNYRTLEGYKNSPVIHFDTLTEEYSWKVFSVFLTNTNPSDDNGYVFNYTSSFNSQQSFDAFVADIRERSIIYTNVDVQFGDKLLTLSTCAFDFDDARLVVVARLVREGESESVDTSGASLNPDPKYPQIWYDKNGTENTHRRTTAPISESVTDESVKNATTANSGSVTYYNPVTTVPRSTEPSSEDRTTREIGSETTSRTTASSENRTTSTTRSTTSSTTAVTTAATTAAPTTSTTASTTTTVPSTNAPSSQEQSSEAQQGESPEQADNADS